MKPDASHHDPRPEYLRALLADAGLTQREAAERLGVDPRTMRLDCCRYVFESDASPCDLADAVRVAAYRYGSPCAKNLF